MQWRQDICYVSCSGISAMQTSNYKLIAHYTPRIFNWIFNLIWVKKERTDIAQTESNCFMSVLVNDYCLYSTQA